MSLSGRQSLAQTQFANRQPWWNRMHTAENLGSIEKDVDDEAFAGRHTLRLPDLSEIEGDEQYFDS